MAGCASRRTLNRDRAGAIIYGRSDATINCHGIRMGTSELYRAVEALPEVLDSLMVDLEYLGRDSGMPLFVVLREGVTLDDALAKRIKQVIRQALSARHAPNDAFQVAAVPRTLSGKKMELPVKKLLLGAATDSVFKRDAMANADCVDWFVELAGTRAGSRQRVAVGGSQEVDFALAHLGVGGQPHALQPCRHQRQCHRAAAS